MNVESVIYYYGEAKQDTTSEPGSTPDTPAPGDDTPGGDVTPDAPVTDVTFFDIGAPLTLTAAPAATPAPAAGVLGANRPAGGAPAQVLGANRQQAAGVLGARRDGETADSNALGGWLAMFMASGLMSAYTLGRRRRGEYR